MLNRVIDDVAALESFAALCAQYSNGLNRLYLKGDLGSGKTSFVRGLLQALGHAGAVKSPTYTLVEPYQIDGRNLYHFDLYRLSDPEELEAIGVRDYFTASTLCLVEWPEQADGYLPKPDVLLTLEYASPGRKLTLQAHTQAGTAFVDSLTQPADKA